ncbi:family 20 glycosylhydrolase, partial [Clostridium perfringens]|nr:family 20 glycosylhydrolase [Clostridium perfringens]
YNMTTIGWQGYDEVVTGDENAICQYWDNSSATGNNFKGDLKQLVSPANKAYIDQKYDRSTELGLSWAGPTSVKQAYEWDPTDYGARDRIIGIEAPLWSETIRESKTENLEFLAFPRLLGLAEIGWSQKEYTEWETYKPRLIAHGERMKNQGINYFKDPNIWEVPYEPENAEWNMDEAEGTVINDKNGLYPGTIK